MNGLYRFFSDVGRNDKTAICILSVLEPIRGYIFFFANDGIFDRKRLILVEIRFFVY